MPTKLILPKDKEQKIDAIQKILATGMAFRAPLRVEWVMAYWYLQGVRRFNVASWRTGRVNVSRESPEGVFELRVEDTLNKYQRELGRLMRINTLPRVSRKKLGLDDARKAAVGQVILDDLANSENPEYVKMRLLEGLLIYGTMGLAAWVNKDVGFEMQTKTNLINPWELLPAPGRPTMEHNKTGLVYHRWVPYEWLRETQKKLKLPRKDSINDPDPALELRWIMPGHKVEDSDSVDDEFALAGRPDRVDANDEAGRKTDGIPHVHVKEVWGPDEHDRVCSYDVLVGRHLAHSVYYEDDHNAKNRPPIPIGVARYNHAGGFWGRSFVGPLLGINMEVERMMANLFENVKNLDQFGFLWLPNTLQIHNEDLTSKVRPKVIRGEPDYNAPTIEPKHIAPYNAGDAPGRVAATGLQLIDRLSRESDLYSGKAPGRVDSASGLGLLYETSSIPTIPVSASIDMAYSTIYRAYLHAARSLLGTRDVLKLSTLDDAVAGAVIDPASGTLRLDEQNSIPDPDEVLISIKEREPRLVTQQKQELLLMLERQIIDPEEFIWENYTKDLGFITGNKLVIEERKKGMFRNIVQFNDGKTPGGVIPSSLDNHKIQIRVLRDFMAQPVFTLAEEPVRSAFEQRLQFHEAALGGFPNGLPDPSQMGPDAAQWGAQTGQPLPPALAKMLEQAGQEDAGIPQGPGMEGM